MLGYTIKTFYDNCAGGVAVELSLFKRKLSTGANRNQCTVIAAAFVYAAAAIVLFAMFYPVLSGAPCDYSYAENWLKWFDSWVLL